MNQKGNSTSSLLIRSNPVFSLVTGRNPVLRSSEKDNSVIQLNWKGNLTFSPLVRSNSVLSQFRKNSLMPWSFKKNNLVLQVLKESSLIFSSTLKRNYLAVSFKLFRKDIFSKSSTAVLCLTELLQKEELIKLNDNNLLFNSTLQSWELMVLITSHDSKNLKFLAFYYTNLTLF